MEGIYYFGEFQRWNLGFVNPNVGGAFVAMLIALVIPFTIGFGFKKSVWRVGLFIVLVSAEFYLYFLLAKTYSRGALVALAATLFFCAILFLWRHGNIKKTILIAVLKFIALVGILYATGFIGRVSPQYVATDGSVGARTQLWQGGLKMLAASPIKGWGVDNSGAEYINWYQDLADNRMYSGMVNSYLHVAVERGLPILFVALLAAFSLVILGIKLGNDGKSLCRKLYLGASLAIFAFCVSNIFSTLWLCEELQIFALICGILILTGCIAKKLNPIKPIACGAVSALTAVCALYIIGVSLPNDFKFVKTFDSLKICGNTGIIDGRVFILPDNTVFGTYYGKQIRKLALNYSETEFIISDNRDNIDAPIIILSGRNISSAYGGMPDSVKKIIVINPLGEPSKVDFGKADVLLLLGRLDAQNKNRKWQAAAKEKKWDVQMLDNTSQRISFTKEIMDLIK